MKKILIIILCIVSFNIGSVSASDNLNANNTTETEDRTNPETGSFVSYISILIVGMSSLFIYNIQKENKAFANIK